MLNDESIAMVSHEANGVWSENHGDDSQPLWEDAPDWQKESAIQGVAGIRSGRIRVPHESHKSWLAQKESDGWVYGEVKDAEAKTHPCMVPYDDLPLEQRAKDTIFFGIVNLLLLVGGR